MNRSCVWIFAGGFLKRQLVLSVWSFTSDQGIHEPPFQNTKLVVPIYQNHQEDVSHTICWLFQVEWGNFLASAVKPHDLKIVAKDLVIKPGGA